MIINRFPLPDRRSSIEIYPDGIDQSEDGDKHERTGGDEGESGGLVAEVH